MPIQPLFAILEKEFLSTSEKSNFSNFSFSVKKAGPVKVGIIAEPWLETPSWTNWKYAEGFIILFDLFFISNFVLIK